MLPKDLNMMPKTDQEIISNTNLRVWSEACLNNLEISKIYGPDGIPPRLLKEYSIQRKSHQASVVYSTSL